MVRPLLDFYARSILKYLRIYILVIPYLDDNQANAATKNAHLKLLFRLCKFNVQDECKYFFFFRECITFTPTLKKKSIDIDLTVWIIRF